MRPVANLLSYGPSVRSGISLGQSTQERLENLQKLFDVITNRLGFKLKKRWPISKSRMERVEAGSPAFPLPGSQEFFKWQKVPDVPGKVSVLLNIDITHDMFIQSYVLRLRSLHDRQSIVLSFSSLDLRNLLDSIYPQALAQITPRLLVKLTLDHRLRLPYVPNSRIPSNFANQMRFEPMRYVYGRYHHRPPYMLPNIFVYGDNPVALADEMKLQTFRIIDANLHVSPELIDIILSKEIDAYKDDCKLTEEILTREVRNKQLRNEIINRYIT